MTGHTIDDLWAALQAVEERARVAEVENVKLRAMLQAADERARVAEERARVAEERARVAEAEIVTLRAKIQALEELLRWAEYARWQEERSEMQAPIRPCALS